MSGRHDSSDDLVCLGSGSFANQMPRPLCTAVPRPLWSSAASPNMSDEKARCVRSASAGRRAQRAGQPCAAAPFARMLRCERVRVHSSITHNVYIIVRCV
jgi:hypothetical protein